MLGRPVWYLLAFLLTSQARTFAGFLPMGPTWVGKFQSMFAEALSQEGGSLAESGTCLAADELIKKRGVDNYREAIKLYKDSLARDPANETLKFKVAEASVLLMRAATNANAVMIDGISDSSENRALWREYAPPAYTILYDFHKANPGDAKTRALMTEAFTYSTSSKGILTAALKGDGFTFMKYVDQFLKSHPNYDSGVAYIFKGAFLLAAPWPVRDIKGAREAFGTAARIEPASRRNNYYVGVSAYHAGDFPQALQSFEKALQSESVALSEVDVGDFFLREAKRGAEASKEKLQESSN